MSNEETTAVEELVDRVRTEPGVMETLDITYKQILHACHVLNRAVKDCQDDPSDLGSKVTRSLVVSGTAENLFHRAIAEVMKENDA